MRWLLISLLLGVLPLIAMQQPVRSVRWNIFPLAHPDAKLLIGVDWRKVLESPIGPTLLKQVRMGGHPLLGFLESIDNVDRLLVSSPGSEDGSRSLLVVGEGRFSLSKVRNMAKVDGAISKRYNDVELLVPPGASNADLHFALVDSQTILFGDGTSVKAAIDRWQHQDGNHLKNPQIAKAVALAATQEIWAVVDSPSETLPSIGMGDSELAQQVEMLELGISTTQNLSAHITVKAISEESVQALSTGLPALLQLAALHYSDQPFLTQVARRLKIVTEKTYMKMGITLDAKLFEQSIAELRAAAVPEPQKTMATAASASASLGQPMPSTPAALTIVRPPARRTIQIIGEDGAMREIPFGKDRQSAQNER